MRRPVDLQARLHLSSQLGCALCMIAAKSGLSSSLRHVSSLSVQTRGLTAQQNFNTLQKQSGDSQDPLFRLFAREGEIGAKLLRSVRKDLADIVLVCKGELKQTNHLRTLMSSLTKGTSGLGSRTPMYLPW